MIYSFQKLYSHLAYLWPGVNITVLENCTLSVSYSIIASHNVIK